VKAAPIEVTNRTTPETQVMPLPPRQAAIQNLPHRWITMQPKKSSTLHRCTEFTKWPRDEVCHQTAPPIASTTPDPITTTRPARVSTPNT
jgi:hypothetical protein